MNVTRFFPSKTDTVVEGVGYATYLRRGAQEVFWKMQYVGVTGD